MSRTVMANNEGCSKEKKRKLLCLLPVSNIIQASLLWKKAEESLKRATLSEKEFYGAYLTHRKVKLSDHQFQPDSEINDQFVLCSIFMCLPHVLRTL